VGPQVFNRFIKVLHDLFFLHREASFHILITNYQILVNEEKLLRRVKWQYMVLDEAQAIKSSSR
jgi:SNF2 family DNA or RNA helicase